MNKFFNLSSQCLPFTDLVSMQLSSFFIVPSPTVVVSRTQSTSKLELRKETAN